MQRNKQNQKLNETSNNKRKKIEEEKHWRERQRDQRNSNEQQENRERERNMGMEQLKRTGGEKQGDRETIGMERRWGMGTGRGAGQRRSPERWRRAKRKIKVSWEGKSWRSLSVLSLLGWGCERCHHNCGKVRST